MPTEKKHPPDSDALVLGPEDAAHRLGVSRSHFDAKIAPQLPQLRAGRRRLFRVADLERWVEEHVEAPAA
jgi:excisionase family DNA binding protein